MYELHSLVDLSPYHQDEVVFGIGISAIEELNSLLSPDVCKKKKERRKGRRRGDREGTGEGLASLVNLSRMPYSLLVSLLSLRRVDVDSRVSMVIKIQCPDQVTGYHSCLCIKPLHGIIGNISKARYCNEYNYFKYLARVYGQGNKCL